MPLNQKAFIVIPKDYAFFFFLLLFRVSMLGGLEAAGQPQG
jgi:hypothetical protein